MRIKIIKDGPYHVSGGIPLKEMVITKKGKNHEYIEGQKLPQNDEYFLCRCGHSDNTPFCDGAHVKIGFKGKETASKAPYMKRVQDVTKGSTMLLLDDNRCCYARFCHRDAGSVWALTEQDNDPQKRSEAIKAATECPAGRLVQVTPEGDLIEEEYEPEIIILQDPEQGTSAGIFVKGPVVIESADGTEYEVRNRVALCRCGQSGNLPFCDASHINAGYTDR